MRIMQNGWSHPYEYGRKKCRNILMLRYGKRSEIEYLTEKDLPYFRKKAEKGEAVILEIPPEILRSMDIKSLLEDE